MLKKFKYFVLSFILIVPALIPVFFIFVANDTRVCGLDNKNYPNTNWAKKIGMEVSYDFPCEFPNEEDGLFERKEQFEFTGMLLDFFSNTDFAQVFIKDNFDGQNYLVIADTLDIINTGEYLPGDQLKIQGIINKNTKTISANNIRNLSLEASDQKTNACQIVPTERSDNAIGCIKNGEKLNFSYNDDTRFVSGLINPATARDFEIDDFVRVRASEDKKIKTILLEKRGRLKYLKNHIFETSAKFLSLDPGFINIQLSDFPESISDVNFDKNNLTIKLKIKNNTKIVRKYFGKMKIEDFGNGDKLYLLARANDDGSFEAMTIKNNSVWK